MKTGSAKGLGWGLLVRLSPHAPLSGLDHNWIVYQQAVSPDHSLSTTILAQCLHITCSEFHTQWIHTDIDMIYSWQWIVPTVCVCVVCVCVVCANGREGWVCGEECSMNSVTGGRLSWRDLTYDGIACRVGEQSGMNSELYQCIDIHDRGVCSWPIFMTEVCSWQKFVHDLEVCVHVLVGGRTECAVSWSQLLVGGRGKCDLLQYGILTMGLPIARCGIWMLCELRYMVYVCQLCGSGWLRTPPPHTHTHTPTHTNTRQHRAKKIPMLIRRYLPDGSYEDWAVDELIVE